MSYPEKCKKKKIGKSRIGFLNTKESYALGERAFQAAAPHLGNELPLQLRNVGFVETFKNSIKTSF